MKTFRLVVGIFLVSFFGISFIVLSMFSTTTGFNETIIKFMSYSVIAIIVGIVLLTVKGENENDRQEFEEYKRMKMQERDMLYRYRDAKGTPIEEYQMDERTRLITYYDRLPYEYKKKIFDEADRLYRKYENDKYSK